MIEWEPSETNTEQEPAQQGTAPPQRPCFVCGQQEWIWNGERSTCV